MHMLKRMGLAAVVLIVMFVQRASASWQPGTQLADVYGAWAYISTPSTSLDIIVAPQSGQSNWASTPGPNWIQAGWRYYYWYTVPRQYVESCINTCTQQGDYFMDDGFATQGWGTTVDYLIEWVPATTNRWCAYTNGFQRHCRDVRAAPSTVLVHSEVHVSPHNPLDTTFHAVRYKASDMVWRLFSGNTFYSDFPYDVEAFSDSNFHTYRVETWEVFLPVIVK